MVKSHPFFCGIYLQNEKNGARLHIKLVVTNLKGGER